MTMTLPKKLDIDIDIIDISKSTGYVTSPMFTATLTISAMVAALDTWRLIVEMI